MAVFELEQRYVPLIECQYVWQPWGVAGRYTLDEEGKVSAVPTHTGSVKRARSWGGYASHAMRKRFSRAESMDEEEATEQKQTQPAGCPRISVKDFHDILEEEDVQICQSWSRTATEATGILEPEFNSFSFFSSDRCQKDGVDAAFPSETTGFSSESGSPCFFSEMDGSCFSSEASNAFFSSEASAAWYSSEASGISFASDASSRPQKERRRRRAAGTRQAAGSTGSFLSAMRARKQAGGVGGPEITTLMVQKVPYNISRDELLAEVERTGFPAGEGGYNFCHLPRVFKTGKNQGFAFLNFVTQEVAERFAKIWHNNSTLLQLPGCLPKAFRVKVAAMQGIQALEHFAQSKKMQRVKTGTFKPLIVSTTKAVTNVCGSTA